MVVIRDPTHHHRGQFAWTARSSAQPATSGGLGALWRRAPLDWGMNRRRERPVCVPAPYRERTRGGRDGRSRVLQLPGEQAAAPKKRPMGPLEGSMDAANGTNGPYLPRWGLGGV